MKITLDIPCNGKHCGYCPYFDNPYGHAGCRLFNLVSHSGGDLQYDNSAAQEDPKCGDKPFQYYYLRCKTCVFAG